MNSMVERPDYKFSFILERGYWNRVTQGLEGRTILHENTVAARQEETERTVKIHVNMYIVE